MAACLVAIVASALVSLYGHCSRERSPYQSYFDTSQILLSAGHYRLPCNQDGNQVEVSGHSYAGLVPASSPAAAPGVPSGGVSALIESTRISLGLSSLQNAQRDGSVTMPISANPIPPDKPPQAIL